MSVQSSMRCAAALATLLSIPVAAQETTPIPVDPMPPISRQVLKTLAVPDSPHGATLVLVDLAPDVAVGRHTHPGPVAAYVVYGSLEVEIEGQPVRRFVAGESFTVPADTVHDERSGAAGAKIVASFVLPADALMAVPAK
jgi:quercetin dioxygenase-like cupin family protein